MYTMMDSLSVPDTTCSATTSTVLMPNVAWNILSVRRFVPSDEISKLSLAYRNGLESQCTSNPSFTKMSGDKKGGAGSSSHKNCAVDDATCLAANNMAW